MKKTLFIFISLLFIAVNTSKALELSEKSKVSILTFLPGEEVYTFFGHTAIRIYDPVKMIDMVYNYGIFDFDTPNFTIKFVRGNLMYQLGKVEFRRVYHYIPYDNRTVYEQHLNLTLEEKNKLFELLETNYLPENRYYRYDFFYDNCATRVRDILTNASDRKITFDHSDYLDKTFRDILNEYIGHSFFYDFGINILMGINADKKAAPLEYMFIPDYIMEMYTKSDISSTEHQEKFTSDPKLIYKSTMEVSSKGKELAMKIIWAIALIVLGITILEFYNKKYFRLIDILLFLISGLIGLQLIVLWIGSLHSVFVTNFNILWVLPTNIWIAILLIRKRKKEWTKPHALAGILFIVIILVTWNHLPQKFSKTFIPFMLIILIRQYSYYRNYLGASIKIPFLSKK